MIDSVETLLSLNWGEFLVSLAIIMVAFVAVKTGLEKFCEAIDYTLPWVRNKKIHEDLYTSISALKDEVVSLKEDFVCFREEMNEVKNEVNTYNNNRCHDREDSIHIREEMYDDLNNTTDHLRQELIDNVRILTDKIDTMQEETRQRELEKRIDKLRGMIIDFASRCSNSEFKPNMEMYKRIFTAIEEYERILEENHLTNGQCSISMEIARERYKHDLESGLLDEID